MTDRQAFWVSGLATLVVTGLLGTALWARTAPSPSPVPVPLTAPGLAEILDRGDSSWAADPPSAEPWEGGDDDHDDLDEGEHDAHEDR